MSDHITDRQFENMTHLGALADIARKTYGCDVDSFFEAVNVNRWRLPCELEIPDDTDGHTLLLVALTLMARLRNGLTTLTAWIDLNPLRWQV